MTLNKSFIETQFPVSKLSKESYKERKAGSNQTLTGLGKWWGRKPLVLVRAAILGLLMPATEKPDKDMEIFLKIMTMDDEGLILRKNKNLTTKQLFENTKENEKEKYFIKENDAFKPVFKKGLTQKDKNERHLNIFRKASYDEKLTLCLRPEEVAPSENAWKEISDHFGLTVRNLQELIQALGEKTFGKKIRIGDAFSGGGSIPFEAGRMGADVFASDLNPLACLLTWAGLNILNKNDEEIEKLKTFQERIFDAVCEQIEKWGIENNEKGMKAKYYLYCNECKCPECSTLVPLSPNWIISQKYKVVAQLEYNKAKQNFDIIVKSNASKEDMKNASKNATIQSGSLSCPKCGKTTPVSSLRNDRKDESGNTVHGLRKWKKNEFFPRPDDIFQERLYCIKYIDKFDTKTWEDVLKKPAPATDACYGKVYYLAPTEQDLQRENKVIKLLKKCFEDWQNKGFLPEMRIEEGYNTSQIVRERGWQYWHQLFNPRQLLVHGLFMEKVNEMAVSEDEKVFSLLSLNNVCNWNVKLSRWNIARDTGQEVYYNQALNTMFNYPIRGLGSLYNMWLSSYKNFDIDLNYFVKPQDSRHLTDTCDFWITDPPYADAINYHELSEFFLAWDAKQLQKIFPHWYADSKRALAVKGTGKDFNESMVEIYSNLAKNMPDNGMQVVMFTHQDVSVWAELTYILWGSGLRVTAAWNIATETESGGLKSGNYVKGTVLLVLRKQTSSELAFQDELYDEIKKEVIGMIDSMRVLDDKEEPNFMDADYLLAAYASALKVITTYKEIDGIDLHYWLNKDRDVSDEENPVENLLQKAVRIAYDYLIPEGFNKLIWQDTTKEERFFIRALELEMNGESRNSAYQELARGFGVSDYKDMFADLKANKVKLKTPIDYKMRFLDKGGFGSTVLRKLFVGIYETSKSESTRNGIHYLKNAFADNQFYFHKKMMIEFLNFISTAAYASNLVNWHKPAHFAKLLKEALKNEGV
jgi:adenine-specific DNA methylase